MILVPPLRGYECFAPPGLWMWRPAGAMDVSPLRGYECVAPLGLWMWRPSGAMDVAPLRGYGCGAPLGLWMCRPAGAMDVSPLCGFVLLRYEKAEPRRGDPSIERREMILHPAPAGRYTHNPSGASHQKVQSQKSPKAAMKINKSATLTTLSLLRSYGQQFPKHP